MGSPVATDLGPFVDCTSNQASYLSLNIDSVTDDA